MPSVELSGAEAEQILSAFATACPVMWFPSSRLLPAALELALRYQRSVYDCLHLTLAVAEDCEMVTADARFVTGLTGTPLAARLRLLASQSS